MVKLNRFVGLRICLIVLFVAGAQHLAAQVSGVVIDSRSRKPVDYANVFYEGKGVDDDAFIAESYNLSVWGSIHAKNNIPIPKE